MNRKAVIVIPTYNERENIENLLQSILWQTVDTNSLKLNIHILIVDDLSPDGTGDIVKKLMENHENIHLLQGKKEGLGRAYSRGITYALKNLKANLIMQMDADFSHDPSYILPLIQAVGPTSNFVIGSRYVEGGSIPEDWPFFRKLNSKVGNFLAHHLAGLKQVYDCTSGFKAIDAKLLKKIDLKNIGANGYSFQIKLLNEAAKAGAFFKEIPINFVDRTRGSSKIRFEDISEFIKNSIKIRFDRSRRIALITVFFLLSLALGSILGFYTYHHSLNIELAALWVFFIITMAFLTQSIFTFYGMIYIWENPDKHPPNWTPQRFRRPRFSFTAILPALHEEKVIAHTIESVNKIDYPEALKEIIVVCRADDTTTIQAAQATIQKLNNPNIKLLIPDFRPRNKPDKLNFALQHAKNQIVGIFDAEDNPHRDIYNIINTVMLRDQADVVQAGVQLVNFRSNWFSTLNVLEYFFWFKSVLHFFYSLNVTLLGGNTVFFKRRWLKKIDGWNADCLTEDAEIGLRLRAAGARIRVVYDERYATQEETPPTISSFIRQRTRWNQGFLQIFKHRQWLKLPTWREKIFSAYILIWPEAQAFLFIYIIFSLIMIFTIKLPIVLALISYLPLYVLLMQIAILNVGLYEFARKYGFKYTPLMVAKITLTFIPFQLALGYSALRAVYRQSTSKTGWEKTEHVNAHRAAVLETGDLKAGDLLA